MPVRIVAVVGARPAVPVSATMAIAELTAMGIVTILTIISLYANQLLGVLKILEDASVTIVLGGTAASSTVMKCPIKTVGLSVATTLQPLVHVTRLLLVPIAAHV